MNNITIDLHNMPLTQAKREMQKLLKSCSTKTDQITVIHGYHNGDVILKYIRTQLKHPRIRQKIVSLNNGETLLLLN
ncbi:MAG: DNA mismatch repair protein MutS [Oscillospiraceae bacterium]|nr:DNA mismatch repair protein MutS [Oscillospiraceae bacterium]